MTYSIREVADRTGLPASTLRYYEAEGLLGPVTRAGGSRRQYGEADLEWLSVIACLKNTGMPIQEIRRFVRLCDGGAATLEQRRAMLLAHQAATERHIAQLRRELKHIRAKVAYYQDACDAAEAGKPLPVGCAVRAKR